MGARWLLLFSLAVALLVSAGAPRQLEAAPAKPAASLAAAVCSEVNRPSDANPQWKWKFCRSDGAPSLNALALVVVYAHGYQAPAFPKTFQDTLPDGTSIPDIVTGANPAYGFITTQYPANGLVVTEAKADLLALVNYFDTTYPFIGGTRTYILAGASMGGLIATQLAETAGTPFAGALSLCGVTGDFQRQVEYWGHFNSLYRAFYPEVIASWGANPPNSSTTEDQWGTGVPPAGTYAYTITTAITSTITGTLRAKALLDVQEQLITASAITSTSAISDPLQPTSAISTIVGLSYFSFLSAQDSATRLGGNPFDNHAYWYRGLPTITETMQLNKAVPRLTASPVALAAMSAYSTTGQLKIPLVSLHTFADPIVPVDQSLLYIMKVGNNSKFAPFLVNRYGHCTFTQDELVTLLLVLGQLIQPQPAALEPAAVPSPTLIGGAQLAPIVQAFAAAEAVPDPLSFNQLRLPMVHR